MMGRPPPHHAVDVADKGIDDATGHGIAVATDLRKHVFEVAKQFDLDTPGKGSRR